VDAVSIDLDTSIPWFFLGLANWIDVSTAPKEVHGVLRGKGVGSPERPDDVLRHGSFVDLLLEHFATAFEGAADNAGVLGRRTRRFPRALSGISGIVLTRAHLTGGAC
jgi:hypothetical protein